MYWISDRVDAIKPSFKKWLKDGILWIEMYLGKKTKTKFSVDMLKKIDFYKIENYSHI